MYNCKTISSKTLNKKKLSSALRKKKQSQKIIVSR